MSFPKNTAEPKRGMTVDGIIAIAAIVWAVDLYWQTYKMKEQIKDLQVEVDRLKKLVPKI